MSATLNMEQLGAMMQAHSKTLSIIECASMLNARNSNAVTIVGDERVDGHSKSFFSIITCGTSLAHAITLPCIVSWNATMKGKR